MRYQAIILCRNESCNAADAITFDRTGNNSITVTGVQNMLDKQVDRKCGKCKENDWRVLDVVADRSR